MKIDLSGCADQVTGPFNAGRNGGAVAASRIAFKYLLAPTHPSTKVISHVWMSRSRMASSSVPGPTPRSEAPAP